MIFHKLKIITKKIAIGSALFFVTNIAQASGPFIEPGLTFEEGKGKMDLPSPFGAESATIRGVGGLLRAGAHVTNMIFFGVDGRYSRPRVRNDNFNSQADLYNWGGLLGVQMPTPMALRLWGTYIFDGGLDPENDRDFDIKYTRAHGYRLGAGIKLLLVSFNLEYQDIEYDKAMIQSRGPLSANTTLNDIHPRNQSYILSVSLPLFF